MVNQQSVIVRCAQCGTKNRIPKSRTGDRPVCGRCKSPLPMDHVYPQVPVTISDMSFTREVLNFPGPVLVYYWSSSCGYCRTMTPMVDQFASEYFGRIKFTKISLDQNQAMASRYEILGVPTLLLFNRGRLVDRIGGAASRTEVERHLRALA